MVYFSTCKEWSNQLQITQQTNQIIFSSSLTAVLSHLQLKDQLLVTGVKPDSNNCIIAVDDIEKLFTQAIVDVQNMNPPVPSVRLALGGDQKISKTNVPHPGGYFPPPAKDRHNISSSSFGMWHTYV